MKENDFSQEPAGDVENVDETPLNMGGREIWEKPLLVVIELEDTKSGSTDSLETDNGPWTIS